MKSARGAKHFPMNLFAVTRQYNKLATSFITHERLLVLSELGVYGCIKLSQISMFQSIMHLAASVMFLF
jgi:hypothetical protein